MKTEKPNAITVTVRDKKENKSKSFVVYDATLEAVFTKLKKTIDK